MNQVRIINTRKLTLFCLTSHKMPKKHCRLKPADSAGLITAVFFSMMSDTNANGIFMLQYRNLRRGTLRGGKGFYSLSKQFVDDFRCFIR